MDKQGTLRIKEIFYSLQGETTLVGLPTTFIRLTGCPLRCQYCDTAYAFSGGERLTLDAIIQQVQQYQTQYITVSGGEPLAQPRCLSLLTLLCDSGYTVSLETSGALAVDQVDPRVIKIVDIKTPGSQQDEHNHWQNFQYLQPHDQIKFVICDYDDYQWSKSIIDQYRLIDKHPILFSPSYHQLNAQQLADWIIDDQLAVRMQIQLHKYLWGDVIGK